MESQNVEEQYQIFDPVYKRGESLINLSETTPTAPTEDPSMPVYFDSLRSPLYSIVIPFIIAFYLLIIFSCFNFLYKCFIKPEEVSNTPQITQNVTENLTPPPSYSIFIGSGESLYLPPPYRMVFPYIYTPDRVARNLSPSSSVSSINEGINPSELPTYSYIMSQPVKPDRVILNKTVEEGEIRLEKKS